MSHNIFYDIAYQCKSKTLKLELTHLAKVVTMTTRLISLISRSQATQDLDYQDILLPLYSLETRYITS